MILYYDKLFGIFSKCILNALDDKRRITWVICINKQKKMIIPVRSKFVCWRSENGSIPFPETGQRNLLHVQRRQRIEGKREGNEETKEKKKIKRCAVVVSRSLDENDIILSIRTDQHQQQKHFCTLAATAL